VSARAGVGQAPRERFVRDLVLWLNQRFAPPGVRIAADTPLFAHGLIDSIAILKLIAWTERALDVRIPDEQIRMDNFHSAARMADVFAARR
jgi:acyl carrier protein